MPVRGAGDLNRLVTFESPVSAPDESGGQTRPTWETHLQAWADFAPRTGAEGIEAMRERGVATFVVTVRQAAETLQITPKMRVREGDAVFNIIAPPVDPDGRRKWLAMVVEQEG